VEEKMGNQHNQTQREWVHMANEVRISGAGDVKGTGIFLIGAPDKQPKWIQSVLVPDLTYVEAVRRGEKCLTVKWVPDSVMTFQEISKVKGSGGCNALCLDVSDCHNVACTCYDNECAI
jgi:hypothetical protein